MDLPLVHFTAEPLSVKEVAFEGFNLQFENETRKPTVAYDFQSIASTNMGSSVQIIHIADVNLFGNSFVCTI